MKRNNPLVFSSILLMLAIGSYFRISGNENIRTIQFLSIFAIGMLSGVIIRELIAKLKGNA
jgi:hypothetical protein